MSRDEHEMLIEYSEMTAFNFNSKEYQEIKEDYVECKKAVNSLKWFIGEFTKVHKKIEVV